MMADTLPDEGIVIDFVDRELHRVQGLEAVAKWARGIGSMRGQVDAMEKRLADLTAQVTATTADLAEAGHSLAAARAAAKEAAAQAQQDAAALISGAEAKADAIQAQADAKAGEIVRGAADQAAAINERAQVELADVRAKTATADAVLIAVNAQVDAAQKRLAETEAQIAALRAAAAAVLG